MIKDKFHNLAIEILAYLRGYDEDEVERWIDENEEDYCSDTASDYAWLISRLKDSDD